MEPSGIVTVISPLPVVIASSDSNIKEGSELVSVTCNPPAGAGAFVLTSVEYWRSLPRYTGVGIVAVIFMVAMVVVYGM